MLIGDRAERRPAERILMAVMGAMRGIFVGGMTVYRAIDAADVARAMLQAAIREQGAGPVEVYEGKRLFTLAK